MSVGYLMSCLGKRCVLLRGSASTAEIMWYGGCVSDDQVRADALMALGVSAKSDIVCRDAHGDVVALCPCLPSGLTLDAELRGINHKNSIRFRGQLIKFENVQAHLANERTWLAWVRTALSSLTVSLSILAAVTDSKGTLAVLFFLLGGGFVALVIVTFVTGWLRYARISDVLMLTKRDVPAQLHRAGLGHQARFMFILFAFLSVLFLISADY